MNANQFAAEYFEKNPLCELSGDPGEQVHHIFGKWCDALKYDERNLCTLKFSGHDAVEFRDVQKVTEDIIDVKINKFGDHWIEFARRWGGKTWRIYCEKRDLNYEPLDSRATGSRECLKKGSLST